ncbi:hypothetical protein MKW94_014123 [Papaver nudicaule]|uniref:PHD finger protein ALFIN-LIKE n=1 Tax=Papaver nudicaule TaxID=74823 RepID=A0AA41S7U8_PAPNU|nr:hypothetical protein [Papaver nudicaule]
MQEKDWLSLVAVHSDAWLLAVAFYFGARFGFEKNDSNLNFDEYPKKFLNLNFTLMIQNMPHLVTWKDL